jgi:stearoyl-CoA desaturase (delta-9 desaturase)
MIVTASSTSAPYDGTGPFPAASAPVRTRAQRTGQVTVTGLIVVVPFAGLIAAIWLLWGRGVGWADLGLAVLFYLVTGFGVTVGFHRCLTHRSFTARPALRVALAVAGSMAFEGDVIGWVATHRRHHAFTDRPGDPHSPYRYGTGVTGQFRGLAHAHMGWLFRDDPTPATRYAPDLLADPAMTRIARAFPALCAVSLILPALAGWAAGGNLRAALTAFLWAGLVRILVLHHVTWSVNSVCHLWGFRPYRSGDQSRDNFVFGVLAMGEGFHNTHHAFPTSARHGLRWWQLDVSYYVIRALALARLAWNVKLPSRQAQAQGRRT